MDGDFDQPKALLMDFDDTLFDNSFVPASVEQACEAVAASTHGVDAAKLLSANRSAWNHYWPQVERRCWMGEMEVLDVSREVWRRALAGCGHHDPGLVDFVYRVHQEIGTELSVLFDDVPDFLNALTNSGIATALVTNSSVHAQMAKIAAVGLESAFSCAVISGAIGVAKPDPVIFAAALDYPDLAVGEVCHGAPRAVESGPPSATCGTMGSRSTLDLIVSGANGRLSGRRRDERLIRFALYPSPTWLPSGSDRRLSLRDVHVGVVTEELVETRLGHS